MHNNIDIKNLTKEQKLQVMEALREDLSKDDEISSPEWHAEALKQTEEKKPSGEEKPLDWNNAKNNLRSRFQ